MKERVIISSYPKTVVIGNRCWRPGINRVCEAEWGEVHWPSVQRDPRLVEKNGGESAESAESAACDAEPQPASVY